jgi:hypothetical protein
MLRVVLKALAVYKIVDAEGAPRGPFDTWWGWVSLSELCAHIEMSLQEAMTRFSYLANRTGELYWVRPGDEDFGCYNGEDGTLPTFDGEEVFVPAGWVRKVLTEYRGGTLRVIEEREGRLVLSR